MALQATIERANVALFQLKSMSNSISTANESVLLDDDCNEVYDIESIQALSQAVSALVGATITFFESAEDGSVKLGLSLEKIKATFHLDSTKRLSNIEVSESWIDIQRILVNAQIFNAPDDLRFAITSLQEAQYAQEIFHKDVTEFRRTLLIQPNGPMEVKFTFRTGLQCMIAADISYNKGPGSVCISNISHSDFNFDNSMLLSLKWRTNAQCFSRLQPLIAFVLEQKI
jgi:hypothetical protein